MGSEDDKINITAEHNQCVDKKARTLAKKVEKLFPKIPIMPSFSSAGTFAEMADGLAFSDHIRNMDSEYNLPWHLAEMALLTA